ncbi:hypothetical protein [Brevibacillus borstelensis]|nr:hypothetical protein [Brevibacillus borstelensis]
MKKLISSLSSLFLIGAILFTGVASPKTVEAKNSSVPIKDIESLALH